MWYDTSIQTDCSKRYKKGKQFTLLAHNVPQICVKKPENRPKNLRNQTKVRLMYNFIAAYCRRAESCPLSFLMIEN